MKKWARWQDWVALAAGVLLLLTPLWSSPGGGGLAAMIILGAALGLTAVWSLYDPGAIASEYTHAAIGLLMIITPFVFAFTGTAMAAATCWVLGVIAVAVGLLAVPVSTKAHRPLTH